jgi:hypothetical protein
VVHEHAPGVSVEQELLGQPIFGGAHEVVSGHVAEIFIADDARARNVLVVRLTPPTEDACHVEPRAQEVELERAPAVER